MMRSQGRLAIAEPSRYLTRLCYHFSKKIEVEYTEQEGLARFAWGLCRLRAEGDVLHFEAEAEDAERLAQVRQVIDAHVALFARRTPMTVEWREGA